MSNTIAAHPEIHKRKARGKAAPHPDPLLADQGFSRTILTRFWSKVNKTDTCWLWTANADTKGYGNIHIGGAIPNNIHAHRASWMIHFGPIPAGFEVCHSCDSDYPPGDISYRRCIRPDHLHLATHAQNMRESADKGRARGLLGGCHNMSKLTDANVLAIRARYQKFKRGHGCVALGKEFGVHSCTIHSIVTRQTWNHI